MKKSDFITILVVAAVVCGFAFIPGAWDWFLTTTTNHGLLMSFFKFAILGTFGEMLAMRIREGVYMKKGFGLLPKLLVWGAAGVRQSLSAQNVLPADSGAAILCWRCSR